MVCSGRHGRRPSCTPMPATPLCRVCWLGDRMIRQVRWLFDSKSPDGPRDVGDTYMAIFSLLEGARPDEAKDDQETADYLKEHRDENVTALAMVAARRWVPRDGKEAREWAQLAQRARRQGVSDIDLVKIDLCREGVVSALRGLPRRYRLKRKWSEVAPWDDEVRRTLRRFFNRAIRIARDALAADGPICEEYIDGVTGSTPADDGPTEAEGDLADELAEGDDDPSDADDSRRREAAERLQRLMASVGPRTRELLEARREHPEMPWAALARSIGMSPNAARQARHRLAIRLKSQGSKRPR